jgi:hypothetical protein
LDHNVRGGPITRATEPLGRLHGSPLRRSSASAIITGGGRELLSVWRAEIANVIERASWHHGGPQMAGNGSIDVLYTPPVIIVKVRTLSVFCKPD